MTTPLILAIPRYEALARSVAETLDWELGEVERRRFPDGEVYQRIQAVVRAREVILVAGTVGAEDTLLAYDLACALSRYGAERLTWVIPFFGCQTMERTVKPGEVVTAKTRARLISAVPSCSRGTRVVLLDLHADGIAYYFGDSVHAFHLYAKPVVLEAARTLGGEDFVLAAPDAGRAKWVQSLANDLGVEVALVSKRRLEGGTVRVTGIDAQVAGRTVVIYDDMIRTGGTLLRAAEAYRAAGAARCYAVTTHLVLPGDAPSRLLGSGLLDGIAGTDSHPRARELPAGIAVYSVAPLIAEWLATS